MVVEIACQCDDLPSHSHVFKPYTFVDPETGVYHAEMLDTGDVRIWVDWKSVAREQMRSGT